jgi:quercetin dioxygenase-like cupin family protein
MSEQPPVPEDPRPSLLARFGELLAGYPTDDAARRGALWRLAEPGRQLDANLLRLPPGAEVPAHAEPDLDVLLVGMGGAGELRDADGTVVAELGAGAAVWLPHGSRRSLAAGPDGVAYLTVHGRRPGMTIASGPPAGMRDPRNSQRPRTAPPAAVGEPACALARVCPECGHLEDGPRPPRCPRCGADLKD